VGPAGLCDANKVDATGNCDCGPLLHDQSKEYIHPKTCEVLPLPTAQRKKRESEAETTIESKQPVVAVPAANYNTLLKRKRRGFNKISPNPKNTIKAD
ncbi:unnamed protein product, partial [Adineta steineri]